METYYHINKNEYCEWKVGDEFDFGREDNYMWGSLAEKGNFFELNGEKHDAALIVKTAFETYIGKASPPLKMKGYHFDPLETLKETIDNLHDAITINRELIFESIRKEFYPELPSRQKCIWLIPNNEESLKFWEDIIEKKHQRIFKVTVDGNIHRTAQKWLIGGTFSIIKWNELAHSYWKGEDNGNFNDEILFEGKIKIIEEINL